MKTGDFVLVYEKFDGKPWCIGIRQIVAVNDAGDAFKISPDTSFSRWWGMQSLKLCTEQQKANYLLALKIPTQKLPSNWMRNA